MAINLNTIKQASLNNSLKVNWINSRYVVKTDIENKLYILDIYNNTMEYVTNEHNINDFKISLVG